MASDSPPLPLETMSQEEWEGTLPPLTAQPLIALSLRAEVRAQIAKRQEAEAELAEAEARIEELTPPVCEGFYDHIRDIMTGKCLRCGQ